MFDYFRVAQEYLYAITHTLYPGKRVSNGAFSLNRIFYYLIAPFFAYKDIGNPCELGTFFSLFPLPTLAALYYWIRSKKKNWLVSGLLIISVVLLFYATVGLPDIIAKITFLSYSLPTRVVDVLAYIQVILLIVLLSKNDAEQKVPRWLAVLLALGTAFAGAFLSWKAFPDYLPILIYAIMGLLVFGFGYGVLCFKGRKKTGLLIAFLTISLFTGAIVRPIVKGFNVVFDKPVFREIRAICEEEKDTLWITEGQGATLSAYAIMAGAPTMNGVNTYPNLALWEKLDPKSQYEEIYNRYAHVLIELTDEETSFELVQADMFTLHLSYRDLEKIGIDYLLATSDVSINEKNSYVTFDKIYDEYGMVIYHISPL